MDPFEGQCGSRSGCAKGAVCHQATCILANTERDIQLGSVPRFKPIPDDKF